MAVENKLHDCFVSWLNQCNFWLITQGFPSSTYILLKGTTTQLSRPTNKVNNF